MRRYGYAHPIAEHYATTRIILLNQIMCLLISKNGGSTLIIQSSDVYPRFNRAYNKYPFINLLPQYTDLCYWDVSKLRDRLFTQIIA